MIRQFKQFTMDKPFTQPVRMTKRSNGYDFIVPEDITLPPKQITLIPLNVAVEFGGNDECLLLLDRSSNPIKRGIKLANSVGLIDNDYEGEIMYQAYNMNTEPYVVKAGDRICQGIFVETKRLVAGLDNCAENERGEGGHGSTGSTLSNETLDDFHSMLDENKDVFERLADK